MEMKRLRRFLMCVPTSLLAMAIPARAAQITGGVTLSGDKVADAVVSIEGVKAKFHTTRVDYVMDHRDLGLVPHVLVVRAGSAVRFENTDGMPCRVYSISPTGSFILRGRDGKPMTLTFERTGVIEVRCAEHPALRAYVIVRQDPLFGLTDAEGQYEISKVPPGRWTLQVWYEGKIIEKRRIEVSEERETIDFRLSRTRREAGRNRLPNSGRFAHGLLPMDLAALPRFWNE